MLRNSKSEYFIAIVSSSLKIAFDIDTFELNHLIQTSFSENLNGVFNEHFKHSNILKFLKDKITLDLKVHFELFNTIQHYSTFKSYSSYNIHNQ